MAAAILVRGHTKNSIGIMYCDFVSSFSTDQQLKPSVRSVSVTAIFSTWRQLIALVFLTLHSLTLVVIFRDQRSHRYISAAMLRYGYYINEPTGQKLRPI